MINEIEVFAIVRLSVCASHHGSHLDRPFPHDLAQFSNVVILLNGCS